jgi:glyoxylase-like metal-dependent hydrolase (beta-lactamase superfamily II)
MERLAAGISYVDLKFQETPRIIGTAVIQGSDGVALLDPGPTSTLSTLRQELDATGVAIDDITTIVLTHIHLDHAGATGTLVKENPRLKVLVHEKGAPHLVNPEKLLASAARLYGTEMDRLWGEVRAVPADSLVLLAGGERVKAGGRELSVAYTPGHASHHVSYFSAETGIAFVGDTAGIKRTVNGYVLPPTPPPDIDPESWNASLDLIGQWRPETVFLTHFGPSANASVHIAEMRDNLSFVTDLVKTSLVREDSDEAREAWFTEQVRLELRRRLAVPDADAYEVAGRFDLNWRGLARYLRKRAENRQDAVRQ